jgi:hypothetical protein
MEREASNRDPMIKTGKFLPWKSDNRIVAMNRVTTGERRRVQKLNSARSILFVHRDETTRKPLREKNDRTQIGSQENFRELNGLKAQGIYRPVSRELKQYSEEPVALIGHGGFCEGATPLERRE